MKAENCREYLNKRVGVGVPHWVIPDKLFYYFGELVAVKDEYVIIQDVKGLRQIEIRNIRQIVNDREGQHE